MNEHLLMLDEWETQTAVKTDQATYENWYKDLAPKLGEINAHDAAIQMGLHVAQETYRAKLTRSA